MNAAQSTSRAGLVLVALLLCLLMAASLGGEATNYREESVDNEQSDGRRGAMLLLRELGFDARAWRGVPEDLQAEVRFLWMPKAPSPGRGVQELRDAPGLGRTHHPIGYRQMLLAGATIVLPWEPGTATFLSEDLGHVAFADMVVEEAVEEDCRAVFDGELEVLEVSGTAGDPFARLAFEGIVRVLVEDEQDGAPMVISADVGRGRVIVLSADQFLRNDEIGRDDNALLLVRLVELLAEDQPIYFDEYALGAWRPPSIGELAATPRVAWILAHLVLLLGLFIWHHSWVREFPRDPAMLSPIAPLTRARAAASLLEASGRWSRLGERLLEGVFERLERTLRVAPPAGPDKDARRIKALLLRVGVDNEEDSWREGLLFDVDGPAELEQLSHRLTAFEDRLDAAREVHRHHQKR